MMNFNKWRNGHAFSFIDDNEMRGLAVSSAMSAWEYQQLEIDQIKLVIAHLVSRDAHFTIPQHYSSDNLVTKYCKDKIQKICKEMKNRDTFNELEKNCCKHKED